ncbi:hypothetical protein [Nocardia sp. BMG51109]|uniref:hypothetical protein n=1 Tax=Nocardia sp. BMG51109 TaxID=1056816 RepID=UPI0012EB471E|nr:hypothetical protein [Nocardia sp. BMG51109]
MPASGSGWTLMRRRAAADWNDRHRIWPAGGLLIGHTAFMMPASPVGVVTGTLTLALEAILLRMPARRVDGHRGGPVPGSSR